MTTENNIVDIRYAESFVNAVARSHMNPDIRARAQVVLATIAVLNLKRPAWREELLQEMNAAGVSKNTDEFFSLPRLEPELLFEYIRDQVITPQTEIKPIGDSNE